MDRAFKTMVMEHQVLPLEVFRSRLLGVFAGEHGMVFRSFWLTTFILSPSKSLAMLSFSQLF